MRIKFKAEIMGVYNYITQTDDLYVPCCSHCHNPLTTLDYCSYCRTKLIPLSKLDKRILKGLNKNLSVKYKDFFIEEIGKTIYIYIAGKFFEKHIINKHLSKHDLRIIAKAEHLKYGKRKNGD